MTYISLPEEKDRLLVFYLAMEEYVARYMDVDDAFFMWQTAPTVIFGRNQLIHSEVNVDYCRKNGIQMFRRKSGGGCVYSDMGNVMFSYVTKEENVNMTFNRYVNMVALVLCKLGVNAKATGRNDILIDGKTSFLPPLMMPRERMPFLSAAPALRASLRWSFPLLLCSRSCCTSVL